MNNNLNERKNTKTELLAMLYMEHQDLSSLTPIDIAEKFEATVQQIDSYYLDKEKTAKRERTKRLPTSSCL